MNQPSEKESAEQAVPGGPDKPNGSTSGNAGDSPFQLCGECQATRRLGDDYCWLCGAALEPIASSEASSAVEPSSAVGPAADSENRAAFQFSLASMMLFTTLIAVLLGVYRIAFGLGFVLTILVTPALVRTCLAASRGRAHGRPMPAGRKISFFTGTLGLITIIAVAVPAAFVATCFPIGLAGFSLGGHGSSSSVLFVLAWPIGIAVAGGVLYLLLRWFRRLWPRGDTHPEPPDETVEPE